MKLNLRAQRIVSVWLDVSLLQVWSIFRPWGIRWQIYGILWRGCRSCIWAKKGSSSCSLTSWIWIGLLRVLLGLSTIVCWLSIGYRRTKIQYQYRWCTQTIGFKFIIYHRGSLKNLWRCSLETSLANFLNMKAIVPWS